MRNVWLPSSSFSANVKKDAEVRDRIDHLGKYWSVVSEKRHLLMHSALYGYSPLQRMLGYPVVDPDILRLSKFSRDDWKSFNVLNLSLPNLRAIADQLHAGRDFAQGISSYLFERDDPLGLGLRIGKPPYQDAPTPLPDKPPIPRKLKLHPNPTFGPIAPDPRKPPRG